MGTCAGANSARRFLQVAAGPVQRFRVGAAREPVLRAPAEQEVARRLRVRRRLRADAALHSPAAARCRQRHEDSRRQKDIRGKPAGDRIEMEIRSKIQIGKHDKDQGKDQDKD